jgi:multiple sugar transport system ATP-binding protein
MRMIAGLESVTSGTIAIGGIDLTHVEPRRRDIAMVFQNYALYPHMTAEKNLAYGLKVRKTPRDEIRRRVDGVARMLGLEELLGRRPAALSGGQRQRVAMGRAIVREPAAFLMDEPLSNLDAKLRVSMRSELARLHERLGTTTIYVTHDQVEAMTLGQRVAVMRDGRIQQIDSPQALYADPANLFVAAFIGSPSMNLVRGGVDGDHVAFGGFRIPLDPRRLPSREGEVILGIRPHAFEHPRHASTELPSIHVTPSVLELLGSEINVIFPVGAPRVETDATRAAVEEGEDSHLIADDDTAIFTASKDPRSAVRQGELCELVVDPAQFHFFDPASGESLHRERLVASA